MNKQSHYTFPIFWCLSNGFEIPKNAGTCSIRKCCPKTKFIFYDISTYNFFYIFPRLGRLRMPICQKESSKRVPPIWHLCRTSRIEDAFWNSGTYWHSSRNLPLRIPSFKNLNHLEGLYAIRFHFSLWKVFIYEAVVMYLLTSVGLQGLRVNCDNYSSWKCFFIFLVCHYLFYWSYLFSDPSNLDYITFLD